MPTYEYACKACGEHVEVVQGFKDAALTECGRCGGQLRKVFSAAGIIFKGSGYYVTDSRKPSGVGSNGSEASPKKDAGDTSSTPAKTGKGSDSSSAASSSSSSTDSSATA